MPLSPHAPNRAATTDGFEDPALTNGTRAAFAAAPLQLFQQITGQPDDPASAAGDLITDLLHHLHALGLDPFAALDRAVVHFSAEAG